MHWQRFIVLFVCVDVYNFNMDPILVQIRYADRRLDKNLKNCACAASEDPIANQMNLLRIKNQTCIKLYICNTVNAMVVGWLS